MSYASLAAAVVTRIKAAITLTDNATQIRRRRTGEPPHGFGGQVFVAVHQIAGRHPTVGVDEAVYPFAVTISVRRPDAGREPDDRDDQTMTRATVGLDALVSAVYTACHGVPGGYAVLNAASTAGWIEPPIMTSEGEPAEIWDGWLSQTLQFDGAKRAQVGSGIN